MLPLHVRDSPALPAAPTRHGRFLLRKRDTQGPAPRAAARSRNHFTSGCEVYPPGLPGTSPLCNHTSESRCAGAVERATSRMCECAGVFDRVDEVSDLFLRGVPRGRGAQELWPRVPLAPWVAAAVSNAYSSASSIPRWDLRSPIRCHPGSWGWWGRGKTGKLSRI